MNANEIKSITMLIDEAKESAKMQRDLITDDLRERGINVIVLEDLVKNQAEDFELTDAIVSEYFDKISTGENEVAEEDRKEYVDYAIKSIKDLISTDNDLEKLTEEANGEIKSYADYICSEAYDKHRMNNIEMWKTMLAREKNPMKARKLTKAIYIAENRYTLAFMFERLNNPATHEKEKRALVESFFSDSRSNYTLHKFGDKCKQFGFSRDLYKYLLDLEERYLEEKYHVFNNFFLFSAIRFIGHCVDDEINEAKEIVQCMLNLVYSRFYSEDVKETFLNAIRAFLDNFEDDREAFNEKNILHPGHPYRIAREKVREANLREKLYSDMQSKLGLKIIEVKDELDKMSIGDLMRYYEEKKKETEASDKKADVETDANSQSSESEEIDQNGDE